jgi:hypothetical protein
MLSCDFFVETVVEQTVIEKRISRNKSSSTKNKSVRQLGFTIPFSLLSLSLSLCLSLSKYIYSRATDSAGRTTQRWLVRARKKTPTQVEGVDISLNQESGFQVSFLILPYQVSIEFASRSEEDALNGNELIIFAKVISFYNSLFHITV